MQETEKGERGMDLQKMLMDYVPFNEQEERDRVEREEAAAAIKALIIDNKQSILRSIEKENFNGQ